MALHSSFSENCVLYYDTSGVFEWQVDNYRATREALVGGGGGRLVSALFHTTDLVTPRHELYYSRAVRLRARARTDHWIRIKVIWAALHTIPECTTVTYLDSDCRILTGGYFSTRDFRSFLASQRFCAFAAGEPFETRTVPLTPRGDLVNTELNTGFLVFKRGTCAEDLLSSWWFYPRRDVRSSKYLTEWPFDQGALAMLHRFGKATGLQVASEQCSYNCPNGTYVRHEWGLRHRRKAEARLERRMLFSRKK